jgi:Bacterial RNA polymerase, alpha chain C terminal domain
VANTKAPIPITFINDATKPSLHIREIWADITYDNSVVKSTVHKPVDLEPGDQEVIYSSQGCVHQVRCHATFFDGNKYAGTFGSESDYTDQCYTGFDCRIRPPSSILDDPVDSLGLPARTELALKKNKVRTVRALMNMQPAEIANLHGIGPASLADILVAVSRHRLHFRM